MAIDGDVRAVLDRNAVQDLVTRYHRGVDDADWPLLHEQVFTADVVWDWTGHDASGEAHVVVEGRDGFVDWLRAVAGGASVRHLTTGHLVELRGDVASSQSYLVTVDAMSLATLACGVVDAEHTRTPDGWRISRLRIVERLGAGTAAMFLAMGDRSP